MTFSFQEARELYLKAKAEREQAEKYEATSCLYTLITNALKLKLEGNTVAMNNNKLVVQVEVFVFGNEETNNRKQKFAFNWLESDYPEFEKTLTGWFPGWTKIESTCLTVGNEKRVKILFVGEDDK